MSLLGGVGTVSTTLGVPAIPTIAEDLTVMRDISVAEYVAVVVERDRLNEDR